MKRIFNEIATIDQTLLGFQDMLAKIEEFKRQSEQDIATKKQKADLVYTQAIEHIDNQKKQVEICTGNKRLELQRWQNG